MKISTLRKYSTLLIRVGLALVFLANSYTAFVSPDEFTEIIGKSFFAGSLPINSEAFVRLIGISDGTMGILLLLGIGLRYISIYTAVWITGVMATIGLKEPGEFLEHFGSLAMASYIFLNVTSANKK